MKKALLFAAFVFAWGFMYAEDKEGITDIQDEKAFAAGEYSVSGENEGLGIKKGEGFDLKVPEILITGQIDTGIMLRREITSLENLQDIKNVLYEKEKIEMPYSYLREEELTPQYLGRPGQSDFVGRLRLAAGIYSAFLADGLVAKSFGSFGDAVVRAAHHSHKNERVNNRDTASNLNGVDLYFRADHHPFEAVYGFSGFLNTYENPFPSNILGGRFDYSRALLKGSLNGEIEGFGIGGKMSYGYSAKKSAGGFAYKENVLSVSASGERDFISEKGGRIKAGASVDFSVFDRYYPSGSDSAGFDLGALLKVIFFLEPVNLQAGLKISSYVAGVDYFWLSPYIRASYMPFSWLSFYADFTPDMEAPEYFDFTASPYILPSAGVKPSAENFDFRGGVYLNGWGMFTEVFWGIKGIKNNLYLDDADADGIFEYHNNDIEYTYAGISVETLRLKDLSVITSYTYRNADKVSNGKLTYFPHSIGEVKAVYDLFEWSFNAAVKLESGFMGTANDRIGAFALLDIGVEREIMKNFTAALKINNVLNNTHYLLYYYKSHGINGMLSLTYKF